MSDPLPCPKSPACTISCRKCLRLVYVTLATSVVTVLFTVFLLCLLVQDTRTAADPKPTPTPTAPEDPTPSTGPTEDPAPDAKPTAPMPPDPSGTTCNIFDPECPAGSGGLET
ncbi:hypothetical protein ACIP93_33700 [Streptomyces sp. NPDC088745]|uniref:hypothetical protein n=1 Tax=Streptomyces sp. NPDC088745 TaxID=3365884 RepID=UPI003801E662